LNKNLRINRYPVSDNRSLKSFSAADDYVLNYIKENEIDSTGVTVYNDRFGYLSLHLIDSNPTIIGNYKSQEDAISKNAKDNKIEEKLNIQSPLSGDVRATNLAIIKVPKSMDLFRFYLIQIHKSATKKTTVICGFMTKYFTKQMVSIASEYFEVQEQSLAWKKSRLLILSKPKTDVDTNIINTITHTNINGESVEIKQYYGVFSAKHIDYATQFLIKNIELNSQVERVLDVASGNGILAYEISLLKSDLDLHLLDDSYLANESAKLNLQGQEATFHYADRLVDIESDYFDLVICNPPFHFEHENNIEMALELFHGIERVLHEDGRFLCVANLHLNYKTHLAKIFEQVEVIAMNSKFAVYECWKA
jgi:23S rRNA (guanine1835-N2)-methyltransferase